MTTTEKFSDNSVNSRPEPFSTLPAVDPERLATLRANRMNPIDFEIFEAWRKQHVPEQRLPVEEMSLWDERLEAERIAIRAWAKDGLVHSPSEYVPDIVQGPLTEQETTELEAYAAHCMGQLALDRSNLIIVKTDA